MRYYNKEHEYQQIQSQSHSSTPINYICQFILPSYIQKLAKDKSIDSIGDINIQCENRKKILETSNASSKNHMLQ